MPEPQASSKSLRLCRWTCNCFMAPSSKCLDLLPQLPCCPWKNGTLSTIFCNTWGHTLTLIRQSDLEATLFWRSSRKLSGPSASKPHISMSGTLKLHNCSGSLRLNFGIFLGWPQGSPFLKHRPKGLSQKWQSQKISHR